ncbi:MAG: hypothetical protein R8G01_07875 [Ilumatobacteraceae bacterium]|nr:hypothetical protein [Ilumatobacteraceae bacterium]
MASQQGSLEVISDADDRPADVTIQMRGPNVVVRSSMHIDRAATDSVAHLVNASVTSEVVVVIDPEQIECSDAFASTPAAVAELRCCERRRCRARDVETAGDGVLRVAGEQSWWTIDIATGRFLRSDQPLDVHFIGDDAWIPLQGVWISDVKLSVMTADGALITGYRARTDERCTRRLAS